MEEKKCDRLIVDGATEIPTARDDGTMVEKGEHYDSSKQTAGSHAIIELWQVHCHGLRKNLLQMLMWRKLLVLQAPLLLDKCFISCCCNLQVQKKRENESASSKESVDLWTEQETQSPTEQ